MNLYVITSEDGTVLGVYGSVVKVYDILGYLVDVTSIKLSDLKSHFAKYEHRVYTITDRKTHDTLHVTKVEMNSLYG